MEAVANPRIEVEAALKRLFSERGGDVSLDAVGMVTLLFEPDHSITLEIPSGGGWVFAHAPIRHLPRSDADAMLRTALSRNLFRLAGPPAQWIALDSDGDTLMLCGAHPMSAPFDEAEFAAFLDGMLDLLSDLAQMLDSSAERHEGADLQRLDRYTIMG